MSVLKVPDEGERVMLNYLTNVTAFTLNSRTLKLYKAIAAPLGDGTVLADFTEANFNGYAATSVGSWAAAMTISNKAKAVGTPRTWTRSAGATSNTILGYYVISQDTLFCLWAEEFDTPIAMNIIGDTVTVVPTLTLFSEF